MQTLRQSLGRRIGHLRPLRPPNRRQPPHCDCRIFTTSAPLHLLSRTGTRPAIPYLTAQLSRNGRTVFRPLSTDQKDYLRYQLRLGTKWFIQLWVLFGGFWISYWVLRQDWLDRLYPSPSEWTWLTRVNYRAASHELSEERHGRSGVDYGVIQGRSQKVVKWCEAGTFFKGYEDPLPQNEDWESCDFPGLDKEDIRREPVSELSWIEKFGFDCSGKPEHWRRAYFNMLMAMARSAEMNEESVIDFKRRFMFPRNQMIGPSNPNPHPTWPGSPPAPLEEDCWTACDPAPMMYQRVLTTKGISNRQRMEAGLAYAAYLDYKGDTHTAEALYHWSLNLACDSFTAAHPNVPITSVLDRRTDQILANAPVVTPNILDCTTALAGHYARASANADNYTLKPFPNPDPDSRATPAASRNTSISDLTHGLGIYLSVLRARRSAPEAPEYEQYKPAKKDLSLSTVTSVLNWITSLHTIPEMGPPPPNGDEAYLRTKSAQCEEAALMSYVGEILFSTAESGGKINSQRRRDALNWAKDAVELADQGYKDQKMNEDSLYVCTQCLKTGFDNWTSMMRVLVREKDDRDGVVDVVEDNKGLGLWSPEEEEAAKAVERERLMKQRQSRGWFEWLVGGGVKQSLKDPLLDEEDWKRELDRVETRQGKFLEERLLVELNRSIRTRSKWFVGW